MTGEGDKPSAWKLPAAVVQRRLGSPTSAWSWLMWSVHKLWLRWLLGWFDWLIDWLIHSLIDWLVGWLVACFLACWLVHSLVDSFIWLINVSSFSPNKSHTAFQTHPYSTHYIDPFSGCSNCWRLRVFGTPQPQKIREVNRHMGNWENFHHSTHAMCGTKCEKHVDHNWWFGTWIDDFSIRNVIIPNDELIFFRGVAQPPTSDGSTSHFRWFALSNAHDCLETASENGQTSKFAAVKHGYFIFSEYVRGCWCHPSLHVGFCEFHGCWWDDVFLEKITLI